MWGRDDHAHLGDEKCVPSHTISVACNVSVIHEVSLLIFSMLLRNIMHNAEDHQNSLSDLYPFEIFDSRPKCPYDQIKAANVEVDFLCSF